MDFSRPGPGLGGPAWARKGMGSRVDDGSFGVGVVLLALSILRSIGLVDGTLRHGAYVIGIINARLGSVMGPHWRVPSLPLGGLWWVLLHRPAQITRVQHQTP